MLAIRTILHPTDFSEQSRNAFQAACALACDHGARLIVLHVVPPPAFHADVVDRRLDSDYYDALWDALRQNRPTDGIEVEYRLEEGEPAVEIQRVVDESASDLIVMGTTGRSRFARLFLGSVAETIVRTARCPVITVNGPPLIEQKPTGALVGSATR